MGTFIERPRKLENSPRNLVQPTNTATPSDQPANQWESWPDRFFNRSNYDVARVILDFCHLPRYIFTLVKFPQIL